MGKTFEATMTVNLCTTGGLGKTYNEQLEVLKLSSSKINVKQTFIYPCKKIYKKIRTHMSSDWKILNGHSIFVSCDTSFKLFFKQTLD